MAGVNLSIDINDRQLRKLMAQLQDRTRNVRPAMRSIGEAMLLSTNTRFRTEKDPRGVPWAPLSRSYKKRKKGSKILTERGMLRKIAYRVLDDSVVWGTNRIYGAIHQLGGTIKQKPRRQTLAYRMTKDGSRMKAGGFISRRAAGRMKSGSVAVRFASIGARTIKMPARPFLGVSTFDEEKIYQIMLEHLGSA